MLFFFIKNTLQFFCGELEHNAISVHFHDEILIWDTSEFELWMLSHNAMMTLWYLCNVSVRANGIAEVAGGGCILQQHLGDIVELSSVC